jgi:hypothetical protein
MDVEMDTGVLDLCPSSSSGFTIMFIFFALFRDVSYSVFSDSISPWVVQDEYEEFSYKGQQTSEGNKVYGVKF